MKLVWAGFHLFGLGKMPGRAFDMSRSLLFSPLRVGAHLLRHRIVMAPLTRMRASQPGNIPNEMNVRYYAQRANAGGLLVTEATQISQSGQGYPATPGIH